MSQRILRNSVVEVIVAAIVSSSQNELGQLGLGRDDRRCTGMVDPSNFIMAKSSNRAMNSSFDVIMGLYVEVLQLSLGEQDISLVHGIFQKELFSLIHDFWINI